MQNERPDLLRDRRLELGLPPIPPPLRPARGLVVTRLHRYHPRIATA
ncbi:hypothetical protein [Synechococcus sp. BL107]|nr:hypothetical protein [Synechococcus sp. BL107]